MNQGGLLPFDETPQVNECAQVTPWADRLNQGRDKAERDAQFLALLLEKAVLSGSDYRAMAGRKVPHDIQHGNLRPTMIGSRDDEQNLQEIDPRCSDWDECSMEPRGWWFPVE